MAHILVVDDTEDCLLPLARLLRHDGHSVECATNGLEALTVLERFRADSIILDLMMPVMDGFEFLDALRQREEWKDIHVVVLTGYCENLRAERLNRLGVSEILLKGSLDWQRLLKLVT